jgi:low affinity Fe/Cu permease
LTIGPSAQDAIRHSLTRLGELASHPGAYSIIVFYAVFWFVLDPASLDWHGVATLAVWFMTLLIQRTEHRDTQALQAKLDELLHANRQANNALTKIDDQEPEDIVRHRIEARAED